MSQWQTQRKAREACHKKVLRLHAMCAIAFRINVAKPEEKKPELTDAGEPAKKEEDESAEAA